MTHWYVQHDSFFCAPWLIHLCNMTDSFAWHHSELCGSHFKVTQMRQYLEEEIQGAAEVGALVYWLEICMPKFSESLHGFVNIYIYKFMNFWISISINLWIFAMHTIYVNICMCDVCTYIYMHTYICICMYIYECMHTRIWCECVCASTRLCMSMWVCVFASACMCVRMLAFVLIYVSMCACVVRVHCHWIQHEKKRR